MSLECQLCIVVVVVWLHGIASCILKTKSAYLCSTSSNNRDVLTMKSVLSSSVRKSGTALNVFFSLNKSLAVIGALKTTCLTFNSQVEYVSNVQNLHQCVKQSLVCPLMERSLNILLSNVLFSRIPHSQRQAALRIVVCVVFGGGGNKIDLLRQIWFCLFYDSPANFCRLRYFCAAFSGWQRSKRGLLVFVTDVLVIRQR